MLMPNYSNQKCAFIIVNGVKRNQFATVAKKIAQIPERDLAELSGISQRTISRMGPEQLLPKYVAEVVVSIMRTYERALQVFEDEDVAHKWLKTKLNVLGDKTPLEAVSDRFGAELVLDILGRIEHGVFS